MVNRKYCKDCQGEVEVSESAPCPHCGSKRGYLVTNYARGTFSSADWDAAFALTQAQQLPREVLRKVGKCIYCHTSAPPLDTEHIIPKGLGGRWELLQASCRKCAAITSKFERHLLQDLLLDVRAALRLPIQRRNRPETLPFTYIKDDKEQTILLPANEYPALARFPIFARPAYLDQRSYTKGIDLIGNSEPVQLGGPNLRTILERYGAKTVRHRRTQHFDYYPRCFLKIAYGFAVAALGLERIAEASVVPCILGQRDDSGMWMGCDGSQTLPGLFLHEHSIEVGDEIIVRIGLFSQLKKIPEYIVVVGRAAKEKPLR
jgi:hypothetical protein